MKLVFRSSLLSFVLLASAASFAQHLRASVPVGTAPTPKAAPTTGFSGRDAGHVLMSRHGLGGLDGNVSRSSIRSGRAS